MGNKKYDLLLSKNVPTMSGHVGSQLYFSPFAASRLTPFTPSKTSRTKEELKEVNLLLLNNRDQPPLLLSPPP